MIFVPDHEVRAAGKNSSAKESGLHTQFQPGSVSMDTMDLLLIAAGWRGLTLAKMYRQVHPAITLLILDAADTLGGCWAEEQIYPGFHTNNVRKSDSDACSKY